MPVNWLTEAERVRLNRFPSEIPEADLITFFTLAPADHQMIDQCAGAAYRLGFALQLCALRYLGFSPDELTKAPAPVTAYLSHPLGVGVDQLAGYGQRAQTRTDHRQQVQSYLGFRKATDKDWAEMEPWLLERAMEHDRPMLLLELLCERLQTMRIVRPGVTVIERVVSTARQQAQEQTWRLVAPLLTAERRAALDRLLVVDEDRQRTLLAWLRTGATSYSAAAILNVLEKLNELRAIGVEGWDLRALNPNRVKLLAQVGRKSTNQALL